MKIIIFVRHGRSETNANCMLSSDIGVYPLVEEGVQKINAMATQIAKVKGIKGLYASPVLRALQSAEIIGKKINMKPIVDDRLRERFMGNLNNVKFPSKEAMLEAILNEVKGRYKGGAENWDSMQKRMKEFIDSVGDGITVAVTHHDLILAVLGLFDKNLSDAKAASIAPTATATAIDFEKGEIICVGVETLPESLV